mgnify:FL=1
MKAVEAKGVTVLSKWGGKGLTKETVKNAARASLNLVVNVSGMRLARYMESEFGIPYIAGAPFGKEGLDEFTDLMMKTLSGETSDSCIICKGIEGTDDAEVIIAGEQFFCNAIRKDLYNKGYSNIRVISFFEMDKACMVSSDKKISGEDELNEICSKEKVKLVCADPDYRPAVRKEVKWINMPNSGMSMVTRIPQMDLIGQSLDDWISSEL